MPVFGHHVARRAQAVAVQAAGGVAAVGEHHAGRAIPGLHVHGVVFEEGAQVRVQVLHVLPGRRHQHAHAGEQVHAAGQQHFEHVVQALRIRALHLHQRRDLVDVRERGALELGGARLGPLAVAGDGVDLAVVGQEAERLRQAPLRQGVGGEALMEHAHRAFQVRIAQVRVEQRQVGRHHQALVDDDPAAQMGDEEVRMLGFQRLFHPPPQFEQQQLEGELVHGIRRGDEHLLDGRHGLQGLRTAGLRIGRHFAPARQGHPQRFAGGGHFGLGTLAYGLILRQEDIAAAVVLAQLDAQRLGLLAQEAVRLLHQQPAAVTALAVGSHRAAVGHPCQCTNRRFHQPVAGLIVHLGNQTETTAIAFEFRLIQPVRLVALLDGAHRQILWCRGGRYKPSASVAPGA